MKNKMKVMRISYYAHIYQQSQPFTQTITMLSNPYVHAMAWRRTDSLITTKLFLEQCICPRNNAFHYSGMEL